MIGLLCCGACRRRAMACSKSIVTWLTASIEFADGFCDSSCGLVELGLGSGDGETVASFVREMTFSLTRGPAKNFQNVIAIATDNSPNAKAGITIRGHHVSPPAFSGTVLAARYSANSI